MQQNRVDKIISNLLIKIVNHCFANVIDNYSNFNLLLTRYCLDCCQWFNFLASIGWPLSRLLILICYFDSLANYVFSVVPLIGDKLILIVKRPSAD